jgi:hypothetical protein
MWTEKKQYNAKKTVIFLNFEKWKKNANLIGCVLNIDYS